MGEKKNPQHFEGLEPGGGLAQYTKTWWTKESLNLITQPFKSQNLNSIKSYLSPSRATLSSQNGARYHAGFNKYLLIAENRHGTNVSALFFFWRLLFYSVGRQCPQDSSCSFCYRLAVTRFKVSLNGSRPPASVSSRGALKSTSQVHWLREGRARP